MLFLTLHYPGQFEVQVSFPETWDELTTEELLEVCRLQLQQYPTPGAGRIAIFSALLNIRARVHTTLPLNFVQQVSMDDMAGTGYHLVDFLFTGNTRTIQPLPTLTTGKTELVGPADAFNNLTCGEFEDCEIFFNRFIANPSHETLASMAAILYRPKGKYITLDTSGQPVRYDYKTMLPHFMAMPQHFLYSIFTWYSGCKAQLPLLFPTMYEGGGDGEPDAAVFTKCIHAGAGPKNGSRKDIRLMLLKEFYFDCEQEAIHAKKLEEQYNEQRK